MPYPIASLDDLAAATGRPLSAAEQERAQGLLEAASDKVASVTGRRYQVEERTWSGLPRDGRVQPWPRPIVEVLDVEGASSWSLEGQTVNVDTSGRVTVTYRTGYEVAPALERSIVCQAAMRALAIDPESTGYSQEAIDGYSYQIGSAAASGGVGLLPAEREALRSISEPMRPMRQL